MFVCFTKLFQNRFRDFLYALEVIYDHSRTGYYLKCEYIVFHASLWLEPRSGTGKKSCDTAQGNLVKIQEHYPKKS